MINTIYGMNNKMYMNVSAATDPLTKDVMKRSMDLRNKGVDISHLEEDVRIEEEFLNHLFHKKGA